MVGLRCTWLSTTARMWTTGLLQTFRRADTDGHGKLSRQEGQLLGNFGEMNGNGNGFLTPQKIGTF